jgi:hypothetical protein
MTSSKTRSRFRSSVRKFGEFIGSSRQGDEIRRLVITDMNEFNHKYKVE